MQDILQASWFAHQRTNSVEVYYHQQKSHQLRSVQQRLTYKFCRHFHWPELLDGLYQVTDKFRRGHEWLFFQPIGIIVCTAVSLHRPAALRQISLYSSTKTTLVIQYSNGNMLSSFQAFNSRSRSAIHWPHPPQRPVLGHIHYFRQCEIVGALILLYGAEPCDVWASSWSPPVLWREVTESSKMASALSSIHAMAPRRVRRQD